MSKEMLINVSEGEECRIALVEDGRLEELYMERTSSTSHVGNVYKGRVTNVEPSIQAAFVDFGLGRNGFLHISDLLPSYFGGDEDVKESVGRKMARRDRPPIQKCLRRGDEIIVQIIKEGIGTKGPTLSTYVSIPGRILVMMPGMSKLGVSRKIEDEEERKRLRQILDSLKPPKDCGFIIRTAGVGRSKADIERDLKYLTRLYDNINKKAKSSGQPMELYAEGDLVTRTVRDVMTADVERIVVDNEGVAKKIKEFFKLIAPRTKNKVELYEEPVPLFHKYGIEKEIELMYSRHVPLPSGGSLVIDSTEAIVAIDVNSGKSRDPADAETTAFKTDMEAADEIPRQLRLRDLGGIIICDFIDLRFERHRRDLEKCLHDNLNRDRAKTKMLRMSQFGIIEMTRQRMRPSLKRSIYSDCPHCKGAGLVKTPESMSLDVMRRLAIAAHDERVLRVELAVCQDVAFYLQNKKRAELASLEQEAGKRIIIRVDASLGLDESRLELYDLRDGLVYLSELGMAPADQLPQQQGGVRGGRQQQGQGRRGRGGRGGREERGGRDERGGRHQQHDRHERGGRRREEEPAEDRYDVDSVEEQIDEREEDRAEQAAADAAVRAPLPPPQELPFDESAPAPAYEEEQPEDEGESAEERDSAPEAYPDSESEEVSEEEPAEESSDEQAEEPVMEEEQEIAASEPDDDEAQPPQPASPPPYDYEEEIELQPRGITHERPDPKQGRRGGKGGRRGGRGGRGGHAQSHADVQPPAPRGEAELSLAERFAMELAAEKAQRRQQGPQSNRPQHQGGGNRQHPQQGQHRNQQGQGGHRPQHQGQGGGAQQRQPQGPGGGGGHFSQNQQNEAGGSGRRGRRRRRGRGGRGNRNNDGGGNSGGGGGNDYAPADHDTDQPAHEDNNNGNTAAVQPEPPRQPAPPVRVPPPRQQHTPPPPVQRTGSTDRHLLHDEPVLPQPISRPRTLRDLDHIPEDMD